jgi:phosphatidylglycerol---prolipoprotein diacylglyceryl transferase
LLPQISRGFRSVGAVQGGLVAGVVVAVLYARRHHVSPVALVDAAAPGMAFAQSVGRLGCFMAGCCFGKPTHVAWAVTFTDPLAGSVIGTPLGILVHPTQIYEAVATLIIGITLIVTEKRGSFFPGRTFWLYVLLYSCARFVIEFLRGDPRSSLGIISVGQALSLALIPIALIMLARSRAAEQRR